MASRHGETRTPAKLDQAIERLRTVDPRALGYAVDMNRHAAIDRIAEDVARDLGPLDVLANCQGTMVIKPSLEVSEEEFDLVRDTNLKSVYFACTILGRAMLARGQGAIVNIASPAAGFVTGTDVAVDGGYLASGI